MAVVTKSVDEAIKKLKEGKLVALPTETVYGLAGNGLSAQVVASIFEAKQRPFFDPLILHFSTVSAIQDYVKEIDPVSQRLMQRLTPGPLTILLPKKEIVPDLVTSGSAAVAVRVPAHTLIHEVLAQLDFPLAAPSANPFGYISPTRAQHVQKQLGSRIELILDGGPCKLGIESTIVQSTLDGVWIHRHGAISMEEIADAVPGVQVRKAPKESYAVPGQDKSHYSPSKKLVLFSDRILLEQALINTRDAIGLVWGKALENVPIKNQLLLSANENMQEAAANLFTMLHHMDESPYPILLAMKVPDVGLGMAINDRLTRAAAK